MSGPLVEGKGLLSQSQWNVNGTVVVVLTHDLSKNLYDRYPVNLQSPVTSF